MLSVKQCAAGKLIHDWTGLAFIFRAFVSLHFTSFSHIFRANVSVQSCPVQSTADFERDS